MQTFTQRLLGPAVHFLEEEREVQVPSAGSGGVKHL